jgi:hypothetical protein
MNGKNNKISIRQKRFSIKICAQNILRETQNGIICVKKPAKARWHGGVDLVMRLASG